MSRQDRESGSSSAGQQATSESDAERLRQLIDSHAGPHPRRWPGWRTKYEGSPVIQFVGAILRRDRESAGALVGSAIAFRVFQFFVPFLLFVIGVAAIVARFTTARDVNTAAGVTGGLAAQVQTAFRQHPDGRWVATLFGFWGLLVAGRSLSRILFTASAVAWRLPTTSRVPIKVLGSIAGFVFVIGLVVVLINRVRIELGIGFAGVAFLPAVVIYTAAWLGVLFFLPRGTEDPGSLLPGAALVGLTIAAMESISQFYLPGQLAHAGELYGAIGTTVVTLAWFFILGRVVAFAMVLNAVVYEHYGSVSRVVFSLPVFRVVARRSKRVRRFFDLG
jgi:uncharacterized BrkB/YihY/UPF0761 family membrane protein